LINAQLKDDFNDLVLEIRDMGDPEELELTLN
jgi:hypothetical protein